MVFSHMWWYKDFTSCQSWSLLSERSSSDTWAQKAAISLSSPAQVIPQLFNTSTLGRLRRSESLETQNTCSTRPCSCLCTLAPSNQKETKLYLLHSKRVLGPWVLKRVKSGPGRAQSCWPPSIVSSALLPAAYLQPLATSLAHTSIPANLCLRPPSTDFNSVVLKSILSHSFLSNAPFKCYLKLLMNYLLSRVCQVAMFQTSSSLMGRQSKCCFFHSCLSIIPILHSCINRFLPYESISFFKNRKAWRKGFRVWNMQKSGQQNKKSDHAC